MAVATVPKPKPFTDHEREILHGLLRTWFPSHSARAREFERLTGRAITHGACKRQAGIAGYLHYTGSASPHAPRPELCPRCKTVESKAYRGEWPPPRYSIPHLFAGGPVCLLCRSYLERLDRKCRERLEIEVQGSVTLTESQCETLRNLLRTWFRTHGQRADRFHELTGIRLTVARLKLYARTWRLVGYTGDHAEHGPRSQVGCDLCEEPGRIGRYAGSPYNLEGRICAECRKELDIERAERVKAKRPVLARWPVSISIASRAVDHPKSEPVTKQQIALALQSDLHILNPEFHWRHLTGAAKAWKIRRVVAAKLAKVRAMPGYTAAEAAC